MATPYGPARTRQLRGLLWVAFVLCALLAALSLLALVSGTVRYGLVVGVPALLGVAASVAGLRDLEGARLRWTSLGSGAMLALLGLLLAGSVLGLLPSIVGVLLVLVALLPGTPGDRADGPGVA